MPVPRCSPTPRPKTLFVASAALCLAGALAAQTETSPKGYLQKEGSASYTSFGYYNKSYPYTVALSQVDNTLTGAARRISTLFLRRDGELATNAAYAARRVRIAVRCAHARNNKIRPNYEQAASEYVLGGWTLGLDKEVSLPDLSLKPAQSPAPFSVKLPLDTPFSYNGIEALAIQLHVGQSDLAQNMVKYPIDSVHTQTYTLAPGTTIGTGCTAKGMSEPMQHSLHLMSFGPQAKNTLTLETSNAPADAPVLQLLGATNPNLALGGCAPLYCQPIVALVGQSNSAGSAEIYFDFAHDDAYIGLVLYSQSVAFDLSQPGVPLALSNGYKATYPANPVPGIDCAQGSRLWSTGNGFTWPDIAMLRGRAIVIGLE